MAEILREETHLSKNVLINKAFFLCRSISLEVGIKKMPPIPEYVLILTSLEVSGVKEHVVL